MSDILTSTAGKSMLQCCPEYYQTSLIFKTYLQTAGAELDTYVTGIDLLLAAMFVATAPDWALDIWESELGLVSYSGKALDQRRSRIISKIRGIGTVNIALIKSVAEAYTYGSVEVTPDPATYSFTITMTDKHGIPSNYEDMQAAIEEIKPAHLGVTYVLRYLIWNELDAEGLTWNEVDAKALTWNDFELGGWIDA
ncbi:MAG: DUF2313 domain-containing protein [Syntrophomonadaceae bacterium]|nr:DUF2313 domain-containing protein [Syntrophomonadaceae bacterium]